MTEKGIAFRSLDDVERLARIAVASGYTSCRKVEEAAMLMITGQELGLLPGQSLRGIYVVSGKPVLSADLMVAVVRRSGLCDSWHTVESTTERCTITTRRRGESADSTRTWTMADAARAGITGKQTWSQYPATMLRHRCAADLAREVYPDVLMGLYDPEELGAEPEVDEVPEARAVVTRTDLGALDASTHVVRATEGRALPASSTPPALARYRMDLGAAESLIDARDAFRAYRVEFTDAEATAAVADLRAWIAGRGVMLDGAGVTAVLSTLPDAAIRCLDDSRDDLIGAARTCRAASWDEHAVLTVWSALARAYAAQVGAKSAKVAAAALKAACEPGDDDPSGPRGGSKPAPRSSTADAHGSAQDGPQSAAAAVQARHPEAWRETAAGIRAHVGAIGNIPRLANSARKHLGAIAPALRDHAVRTYAERFQYLARDASEGEALARVETWLREGPTVTDLPARPQRPVAQRPAGVR